MDIFLKKSFANGSNLFYYLLTLHLFIPPTYCLIIREIYTKCIFHKTYLHLFKLFLLFVAGMSSTNSHQYQWRTFLMQEK